jgi:transglutaminase-like putative cysteine protease
MLHLEYSPYQHASACGARVSRCYIMRPTRLNQCRAARDLVRPEEVAHLIVDLVVVPPHPWLQPQRLARADFVALWLREQFAKRTLRYIPDPTGPNCDYWCPPSTTFARGGGDCDDLAILACSMMRVTSAAWLVVGTWNGVGHVWVEGVDELGSFMIEATSGAVYRGIRPPGYKVELLANDIACVH